MQAIFELAAEVRTDSGKGASRRLRRLANKLPGIIYGGSRAVTQIMLDQKLLLRALEVEAFYSHILTIHIDGQKSQQVVLKALQRHPYKKAILHVDFQRVNARDLITMRVPIHFMNETSSPGAKKGGMIEHHINDLEIKCRAQHLPEFIEVDLAHLELDAVIHVSDLKLPKGVELPVALTEDANVPVVSVHLPKTLDEDDAPAEGNA